MFRRVTLLAGEPRKVDDDDDDDDGDDNDYYYYYDKERTLMLLLLTTMTFFSLIHTHVHLTRCVSAETGRV